MMSFAYVVAEHAVIDDKSAITPNRTAAMERNIRTIVCSGGVAIERSTVDGHGSG